MIKRPIYFTQHCISWHHNYVLQNYINIVNRLQHNYKRQNKTKSKYNLIFERGYLYCFGFSRFSYTQIGHENVSLLTSSLYQCHKLANKFISLGINLYLWKLLGAKTTRSHTSSMFGSPSIYFSRQNIEKEGSRHVPSTSSKWNIRSICYSRLDWRMTMSIGIHNNQV